MKETGVRVVLDETFFCGSSGAMTAAVTEGTNPLSGTGLAIVSALSHQMALEGGASAKTTFRSDIFLWRIKRFLSRIFTCHFSPQKANQNIQEVKVYTLFIWTRRNSAFFCR